MKETTILNKVFNEYKIEKRIFGGMMNESYLVSSNNKRYIIYIPGKGSNDLVDRDNEKLVQRKVYEAGLTSKNIYFDVETGIKINEFIEGTSLNFLKDEEIDISALAESLKKLHRVSTDGVNLTYDIFKQITDYHQLGIKNNLKYDTKLLELEKFIFSKRSLLENGEKVLSHNDLQKSNIVLSDDNQYLLIDFEFMMKNDPLYDIACFANDKLIDGEKLLEAYYQDELDDNKKIKFYLFRIAIALQWAFLAEFKHFNKEGEIHGYNFKEVAKHFIDLATDAYKAVSIYF
ncbi:MAG: phosphotransferase [Bacilli bacterium]